MFWVYSGKHPFGRHGLLCVIYGYECFSNLDFSFNATETLSVSHKCQKAKRRWTSWIETWAAVIRQHAGRLWWFNSHANYLIHRGEKALFSKKQHTIWALAGKQRTCCSKQKPHTHNYNLLYLTQLHVSWIIRQRLDNPDRNPFHSLSPPPTNSHFAVSFSVNQRPSKDFKFSGSHFRPAS